MMLNVQKQRRPSFQLSRPDMKLLSLAALSVSAVTYALAQEVKITQPADNSLVAGGKVITVEVACTVGHTRQPYSMSLIWSGPPH